MAHTFECVCVFAKSMAILEMYINAIELQTVDG